MREIIQQLALRAGKYEGKGINHDNQEFFGTFEIKPIINNQGLAISFIAKGTDGTIYHQESTTIAFSDQEELCLWTLNNNVPFQYVHKFETCTTVENAINTFKFNYNTPEETNKFRESIYIDLWDNGDISYRYAWGMPNGEFAERSGLRMIKK